jgi:single-stranded DNA-binding protein
MDSISFTVTGSLADAPYAGTTRNGKPMASFRLGVTIPPRTAGGDPATRWYKVWAFGRLAENAAASLVKGDRVTVRGTDMTAQAYTRQGDPEQVPQGQVVLYAEDIAASVTFETLTTAKAVHTGQVTAPELTHEAQADLAVLAGVTRDAA